jgi:hypothetical protein
MITIHVKEKTHKASQTSCISITEKKKIIAFVWEQTKESATVTDFREWYEAKYTIHVEKPPSAITVCAI